MILQFDDNEFLVRELLEYIVKAYRVQISGKPFQRSNITDWVRLRKVPDSYGGHRILSVELIPEIKMWVVRVEGLSREMLTLVSMLESKQPTPVARVKKQRTLLYYKTLQEKGGNTSKKVPTDADLLPENWKTVGIKRNQIAGKSKAKKTAKK